MSSPGTNLKRLLSGDAMRAQFAAALPRHCSADRFVRIALTALSRTPQLADCTEASLMRCLLDLSAVGLEPDGYHAHLIPFRDNRSNTTECTLIVDYKGLVDLCMRSGKLSKLHADVVHEEDEFDYSMGEVLRHSWRLGQDRGRPIGVYAQAWFKDGAVKAELMDMAAVEKIRRRSKTPERGPWVNDFDEMAKKTVFKRLAKWLPRDTEVGQAVALSDEHEVQRARGEVRDVTPKEAAVPRMRTATENFLEEGRAPEREIPTPAKEREPVSAPRKRKRKPAEEEATKPALKEAARKHGTDGDDDDLCSSSGSYGFDDEGGLA